MKTIEGVAKTSAPPGAVWALLADASTWSRRGAWSRVEVEGGAEQGSGAVRVLVNRSAVTLEEQADGGTLVRWRSTYEHAGPFTAVILRLAVRDAAKRLARAAAA